MWTEFAMFECVEFVPFDIWVEGEKQKLWRKLKMANRIIWIVRGKHLFCYQLFIPRLVHPLPLNRLLSVFSPTHVFSLVPCFTSPYFLLLAIRSLSLSPSLSPSLSLAFSIPSARLLHFQHHTFRFFLSSCFQHHEWSMIKQDAIVCVGWICDFDEWNFIQRAYERIFLCLCGRMVENYIQVIVLC